MPTWVLHLEHSCTSDTPGCLHHFRGVRGEAQKLPFSCSSGPPCGSASLSPGYVELGVLWLGTAYGGPWVFLGGGRGWPFCDGVVEFPKPLCPPVGVSEVHLGVLMLSVPNIECSMTSPSNILPRFPVSKGCG